MESEITFTEQQKQILEEKDISEDEVSECISEKVDEGWDQERAVAACLNMAREGSTEPEQSDSIKSKQFMVKGSDIEVKQEDSNGDVVVNVPIQALSEDRDGDLINEKGQESIIRQLKSGLVPLVPNHGMGDSPAMYGFEDIFGQFVDGENRNGTTIGTARLREDHDKSEELVDLLEQDMPVGFSVGFKVLEAEPREKNDGTDEGLEISKVDLMEVSAVGIPSNPEAVPQAMGNAVAMAKSAGYDEQKIVKSIKNALNNTMSEKQDNEGNTDKKQPSLNEKDFTKIAKIFKQTLVEQKASELEEKAEGDVTDQALLEFTASHFEGVDVADLLDAVDEEGGEYVGSLNLPEVASILADRFDVDQGSVLDALEEMDGQNEEDEPDEENVTDEDEDDDDEEMDQSSNEPEEQDGEDTDEEKNDDVPNTAEKNQNGSDTITTQEDKDGSDSEEKSDEETEDPFAVRDL